jgi:hypothetical protein
LDFEASQAARWPDRIETWPILPIPRLRRQGSGEFQRSIGVNRRMPVDQFRVCRNALLHGSMHVAQPGWSHNSFSTAVSLSAAGEQVGASDHCLGCEPLRQYAGSGKPPRRVHPTFAVYFPFTHR